MHRSDGIRNCQTFDLPSDEPWIVSYKKKISGSGNARALWVTLDFKDATVEGHEQIVLKMAHDGECGKAVAVFKACEAASLVVEKVVENAVGKLSLVSPTGTTVASTFGSPMDVDQIGSPDPQRQF